ncbi:hypothetical protein [Abyssisolibacter fermentans]|uniref:hypothetical protein n=1 Tax=Abyssisolibacter fermentans TaxID=1766203 RepID=UPI00082AD244|nr:hypothetical protein [Abyssisolibacter fermentans]
MDKKLLAYPKKNNKGKWNVEVETDSGKLLIGHMIDNIFMEYDEWENEQEAIEFIDGHEGLKLLKKECK